MTTSTPGDFLVVDRQDLPESELQGINYGGTAVSLIFVDVGPGEGPRLLRHPYEEVSVVLEGIPPSLLIEAAGGRRYP